MDVWGGKTSWDGNEEIETIEYFEFNIKLSI